MGLLRSSLKLCACVRVYDMFVRILITINIMAFRPCQISKRRTNVSGENCLLRNERILLQSNCTNTDQRSAV